MNSTRNILIIILCLFAGVASGQDASSKPHKFTIYGGLGPNYYFNNLDVGKQNVNELNFAFAARIMWEPEHKVSLGVETGYNRLYTWNATFPGNGGDIHVTNFVIPLMVVVSMKFSKYFYGNFNMGISFVHNDVTTDNFGEFNATNTSLGDFAASAGYRRQISDRFYLGGELRGFYSSKLDDKNISLLFVTGYRIW